MGKTSSLRTVGSNIKQEEDISYQEQQHQQKNNDITSSIDHNARISAYLESAPYPGALASLNEITRELSKQTNKSTTTTAQQDDNSSGDGEKTIAPGDRYEKEEQEQEEKKPWEQTLETEGIRNPGWCAVAAAFLVNFSVFGNTFTWGNYQKV